MLVPVKAGKGDFMCTYLVTYRTASEDMARCMAAAEKLFGAACITIEPGLFFLTHGLHAQAVETNLRQAFNCPVNFLFVCRVPDDYAVRYSPMMDALQTRLDSVLPPHQCTF